MKILRSNIIIFFFTVSLTLLFSVEGFAQNSNNGKKAADFTLHDMSGKEVKLSSFAGKPVLLNFWATWCPYCRKERAHLTSLFNEYNNKGLIILSVATDNSAETVWRFLKETPASYIVLSDEKKSASYLYNVRGLPTSFLIDREGLINQKLVGFQEWTSTDLKMLIDNLIGN